MASLSIRFESLASPTDVPKCLDVIGGQVVLGAQLNLWLCYSSVETQVFRLVPYSDGQSYQLTSQKGSSPTLCLDLPTGSTDNGARPFLATCDSSRQTQLWNFSVFPSGGFRINSKASGKSIDLFQSGTADSTPIHVWTSYDNLATQKFKDSSFKVAGFGADLQTWWQSGALEQHDGPISNPMAVRQSTQYDVKVSRPNGSPLSYSSFVYASPPRAGNPNQAGPREDGAAGMVGQQVFHWSSFTTNQAVWVDVKFRWRDINDINSIVVRPVRLGIQKYKVDGRTVRIILPANPDGYRISVEMVGSDEYQAPWGQVEPRQPLMIFAEAPIQGTADDPYTVMTSSQITEPAEGAINLNSVTTPVISFKPGVYYMGSGSRAELTSTVRWIYLQPGAFVKGAFKFTFPNQSPGASIKISGNGVLSGEQYVYEADTRNPGFTAALSDCQATCVKMFLFTNSDRNNIRLRGITVANPPYHTFTAYPDVGSSIGINVENYKQVASYYWQTDGIELFSPNPGLSTPNAAQKSTLRNSFFHSNDDVLKLYHSNVEVSNIVIWKGENGPVFQFGWAPRNIISVTAKDIDIIHNRMGFDSHNLCVFNFAKHYQFMGNNSGADATYRVEDVVIDNVNVEGSVPCAFRIYPLVSLRRLAVSRLTIDSWSQHWISNELSVCQSNDRVPAHNGYIGEELGDNGNPGQGIRIHQFKVGGTWVYKNYDGSGTYDSVGHLGWYNDYWHKWNAWVG